MKKQIEEIIFNAMDSWQANAYKYEGYEKRGLQLEERAKKATLKILRLKPILPEAKTQLHKEDYEEETRRII